MSHSAPSALITDMGQRVMLRLEGRFFELSQRELRELLGAPADETGLGISIDGDRLEFEFAPNEQVIEVSASQLRRRLAKRLTAERSS